MCIEPIAVEAGGARIELPLYYDVFAPLLEAPADRPFVVAQIGQSLDGRIATASGESRDINGAAALDHLHRLRAYVDAVVVGVGTIAADDPQLTVRRVAGRSPARVVIDPRSRVGDEGRWLKDDGARRLIVSVAKRPMCDGVERVLIDSQNGVIPPAKIVEALFSRGLRRILIEGGARTIGAFLEARCLDRLHALVAPVIIGSGRAALDLPTIERLSAALKPPTQAYVLDGGDVLIDCDLSAYRRTPN